MDGLSAEPVDEATLIEQRRKRREAIKAKYSHQTASLLPQVVKLGVETDPAAGTPRSDAVNGDSHGKSTITLERSGVTRICTNV